MTATASSTQRRSPRSAWVIVAKREILSQLQSKAFWVGTISTIAIVAVAFFVSSLMGSGGGTPTRIAVTSEQGAAVVAQAVEDGGNVEAVQVDEGSVEQAVRDGEADAALTFSEADGWSVAVMNLMDTPDLNEAVRTVQIESNAMAAGVDPSAMLANSTVSVVPLDGDESGAMAIFIATFAFSILFMLAAVTYGMQIAQSVVTEKESRIVEILAAAVPIRSLLIGKVVGNTLMALGQVLLFVCTALVALSFSEYRSMIALIAPVAGWFTLFFLVGFASLACLWAGAGAMATRVQDLNQTTTPLTMVVMLVYLGGIMAKGTLAEILSYVPIASTVMMPGRLLTGEAGWLEALLALAVSVGFMVVAIWFGVRIYRRGLLQTNAVMSLKDAFTKAS